jgi:hypothetical protein
VVIVRGERRRQGFTPEEVRARLHQRYATAEPSAGNSAEAAGRPRLWPPAGETGAGHDCAGGGGHPLARDPGQRGGQRPGVVSTQGGVEPNAGTVGRDPPSRDGSFR